METTPALDSLSSRSIMRLFTDMCRQLRETEHELYRSLQREEALRVELEKVRRLAAIFD
jgi:hypothetical protein